MKKSALASKISKIKHQKIAQGIMPFQKINQGKRLIQRIGQRKYKNA